MRRASFVAILLLSAVALIVAACSSGNPVEPPVPVTPSGPSTPVSVTLSSSLGSVEAGSTVGTTITVTARPAPANGTQVKINASLGNFGVAANGSAMQLVTLQLVGGSATTTFYGGTQTGTAVLLAQVGTSSGMLNVPVVMAAGKPEADFSTQIGGLAVIFTDTSTGDPTAWSWDFGDGTRSHLENPTHTYPAAKAYMVSLSIVAPGGMSTARKFVTLQPLPGVTAAFSVAVTGQTALFTDQSSGNPTSWFWTFGDCPPATTNCSSGQQSPSHTYATAGTYVVSLTVDNASGVSNTTSQFVNVGTTGKAPTPDFDSQANGLTVSFADRSTGNPTRWSWAFGDGATSTQQNPTHTYAAAGSYNVSLTVSNAAGSASTSKFVTVSLGTAPQANFSFQASGLTVTFADTSTGNPTSWAWNFGDGTTSTQENPTHTYAAGGTYTVTLTAANAAGQSSKNQLVTVTAPTPPQAAFSFQSAGLAVVFTDASTGNPTSWAWNFGDGATSTQQNPSHTYAAAGTYTVTLTATNAAGSTSVSKLVTVTSSQPPQARFCYERNDLIVNFFDASTNTPTSWQWNFGDCGSQPADCTSSAQNPAHTYSAAGSYSVSLLVTNANGQTNVNRVVTVSTTTADSSPVCP